ncbi:hypothetical protein HZH68_006259 [Vespula germanica]|uniref:Uncharacterized protein n=1 Tax=Vespula germanica TaxID=30212 RepID=A0A834KBH2_VESGE|nr:hypothetical protein HZH68_006259 [Vespula germanica]
MAASSQEGTKKGGQITRLKRFSVLQEGNGDDRSLPKEMGHLGCCKDVSTSDDIQAERIPEGKNRGRVLEVHFTGIPRIKDRRRSRYTSKLVIHSRHQLLPSKLMKEKKWQVSLAENEYRLEELRKKME